MRFIPINKNNRKHMEVLEGISKSTSFLGNLENYTVAQNDKHFYGNDFIVEIDDNLVGYIGITDLIETRVGNTVSIYYGILEKYYGNGYGKKIIMNTKKLLQTEGNIDFIIANVDVNNEMGIKTIEKCDFKVNNNFDDEIQYTSRLR